jgi:hypothetical protein
VAARLIAPSQDVATGKWVGAAALGQGLADYGSALFWVSGYAVLGMTLAVVVRSVPVALAIGIAWAGPFEHLVQDAWNPAQRYFPGLLLEAFVAGGTSQSRRCPGGPHGCGLRRHRRRHRRNDLRPPRHNGLASSRHGLRCRRGPSTDRAQTRQSEHGKMHEARHRGADQECCVDPDFRRDRACERETERLEDE